MKIVRERKTGERMTYAHQFDWEGERENCGFAFDCDESGVVDEAALHPVGLKNYHACLTGEVDGRRVVDKGVQRYTHRYVVCARGECDVCKRAVGLSGATNTCECGADYNIFGQRLAPREQWGEETGEHWSDII